MSVYGSYFAARQENNAKNGYFIALNITVYKQKFLEEVDLPFSSSTNKIDFCC